MSRRSLPAALLILVLCGCGGSTVTVTGGATQGGVGVSASGAEFPPIEATVGEKGIERAPTATPGYPTPAYPIETPPPAPTAPAPTAKPS